MHDAEGTEFVSLAEKAANRISAIFHYLNGAIEKVEPDSSRSQVLHGARHTAGQETTITSCSKESSDLILLDYASHIEWLSTGRESPGNLCTL